MNTKSWHRTLELAMTAPNIDNAQPFFFCREGDRLLVYRDETRDRRRGNAGNYASMVGLGCLAECVAIAASGEENGVVTTFQYDPVRPAAPWLMITFQPDSAGADELLPGLKIRCSDRRPYRGGTLTDRVFARVEAEAEQVLACNLTFRPPDNQELLAYLGRCESFLLADKQILPEMLSWVRWSQRQVRQTRDGMPWPSLGVNFLTSRLMWLVAKSKRFRQLMRQTGGPQNAMQKNLERQLNSSAALGCLTVKDTDPRSMYQLGRVFLRSWVRLNLAGYGVQVMANPAIHVFQHVTGILPNDYPEKSKQVFAEGKSILGKAFSLPEDEIPAWMFRTGKSAPLPSRMKTLRLPLERILREEA